MNKCIAVLGANSHIAKGLINNYSDQGDNELFLFARSPGTLREFLKKTPNIHYQILDYKDFGKHQYDIVINCVGAGTPERVLEAGRNIFQLTKTYDDLVIQYLENNKKTIYFYFSSGVVHNESLNKYELPEDPFDLDIELIDEEDVYAMTKICAEKWHRSLSDLNIIDIRVFSYFSRFINLKSKFLITSVLQSVMDKKPFITHSRDIIRDYIHPADLFALIECCTKSNPGNVAMDAYSQKPFSKFELLERFKQEYNLEYLLSDDFSIKNPTGDKDAFFSADRTAAKTGYVPIYSSIDSVMAEAKVILT